MALFSAGDIEIGSWSEPLARWPLASGGAARLAHAGERTRP